MLNDAITSFCRSIILNPFLWKKKRKRNLMAIEAAEEHLAKQQSENLKWQQESFHQILRLIALHKDGIIDLKQVSDFRANLLHNLVTSPELEAAAISRDKLIFLQELLYMKCISEEEYHASKRPLLQRLRDQGAEIGPRDVIFEEHDLPKQSKNHGVSPPLPAPPPPPRSQVASSMENPFWNDKEKDEHNKLQIYEKKEAPQISTATNAGNKLDDGGGSLHSKPWITLDGEENSNPNLLN